MKTYMEKAESALLHTYNRFPVVFDHGEDVYLYDTEGKKYLDFAAGIAVNSLGYCAGQMQLPSPWMCAVFPQTSVLHLPSPWAWTVFPQ